MPIFRKRFPRKANKYMRLARVIYPSGPPHLRGPKAAKNAVQYLKQRASDYSENNMAYVTARALARDELFKFRVAARERSKKTRKLMKARKKANAARKAGFVVKRKK